MIINRTKFTLDEFKAWFEGFGEAIGEAPTPEQWAKIKAKVAEITPAYTGIRGDRDFGEKPRGWRSDESPFVARLAPVGDMDPEMRAEQAG